MKMLKDWFENIKIKLLEHLKIENLANNLLRILKINLLISSGEIHNGILYIKNPIQFILCYINYIYIWVLCGVHISLLTFKDLFSLIYSPLLFDGFRVILILASIALIHISIIKKNIFYGEIKYHLSQFNVGYFLVKDIKSKHKLTEQNYNRLAIVFRIMFITLLYIGLPFFLLMLIGIELLLIIKTKQVTWLWLAFFSVPFYLNGATILTITGFIAICLTLYYKMRFDQLHNQIKSIIPNGKVISKGREKNLLDLINEHNQLAVEIHKLNKMMRQTFASLFINLSFTKIITLYLMFDTKNWLIKLFAFDIFVLYFVFGLALSNLLSLQIKSAHQTLNFTHLVVCRYKMRFKLKLKVKLKQK